MNDMDKGVISFMNVVNCH